MSRNPQARGLQAARQRTAQTRQPARAQAATEGPEPAEGPEPGGQPGGQVVLSGELQMSDSGEACPITITLELPPGQMPEGNRAQIQQALDQLRAALGL